MKKDNTKKKGEKDNTKKKGEKDNTKKKGEKDNTKKKEKKEKDENIIRIISNIILNSTKKLGITQ